MAAPAFSAHTCTRPWIVLLSADEHSVAQGHAAGRAEKNLFP